MTLKAMITALAVREIIPVDKSMKSTKKALPSSLSSPNGAQYDFREEVYTLNL